MSKSLLRSVVVCCGLVLLCGAVPPQGFPPGPAGYHLNPSHGYTLPGSTADGYYLLVRKSTEDPRYVGPATSFDRSLLMAQRYKSAGYQVIDYVWISHGLGYLMNDVVPR